MREASVRRATRRREIVRLSRLTSLDRALVLILVPIWVVCFALAVRSQVRGHGRPALGVAACSMGEPKTHEG